MTNIKLPIQEYRLEDGYLGILGYDKTLGKITFCSSGSIDNKSKNSLLFKKVFMNTLSKFDIDRIGLYIKEHDCSLLFEVISPKRSKIIDYNNKQYLVFLDAIENKIDQRILDHDNVYRSILTSIPDRVYIQTHGTSESFTDAIRNISSDNNKSKGSVFIDSNGLMVKMKSKYYRDWESFITIINKNRTLVKYSRLKESEDLINSFSGIYRELLEMPVICNSYFGESISLARMLRKVNSSASHKIEDDKKETIESIGEDKLCQSYIQNYLSNDKTDSSILPIELFSCQVYLCNLGYSFRIKKIKHNESYKFVLMELSYLDTSIKLPDLSLRVYDDYFICLAKTFEKMLEHKLSSDK